MATSSVNEGSQDTKRIVGLDNDTRESDESIAINAGYLRNADGEALGTASGSVTSANLTTVIERVLTELELGVNLAESAAQYLYSTPTSKVQQMLTNDILHRSFKNEKMQDSRPKVEIKVAITEGQAEFLRGEYPKLSIVLKPLSSDDNDCLNPHGFANAVRHVHNAWFQTQVRHLKRIIDVGGDYSANFRHKRTTWHSCEPIAEVKDAQRAHLKRSRMEKYIADFAYTDAVRKAHLDDYNMDSTKYVCHRTVQECDHKADAMWFGHSAYNIVLAQIPVAMARHGCRVAYGALHLPKALDGKSGRIESIGMEYRYTGGDGINFFFSKGGGHDYPHKISILSAYYKTTLFGGDGCDSYLYEIMHNSETGLLFSITHLMYRPMKSLFVGSDYSVSKQHHYKVRSFRAPRDRYANDRTPLETVEICVPKAHYELVLSSALQKSDKFNRVDIVKALRAFGSSFMMNGVPVLEESAVDPMDYNVLSVAIYLHALRLREHAKNAYRIYTDAEKDRRSDYSYLPVAVGALTVEYIRTILGVGAAGYDWAYGSWFKTVMDIIEQQIPNNVTVDAILSSLLVETPRVVHEFDEHVVNLDDWDMDTLIEDVLAEEECEDEDELVLAPDVTCDFDYTAPEEEVSPGDTVTNSPTVDKGKAKMVDEPKSWADTDDEADEEYFGRAVYDDPEESEDETELLNEIDLEQVMKSIGLPSPPVQLTVENEGEFQDKYVPIPAAPTTDDAYKDKVVSAMLEMKVYLTEEMRDVTTALFSYRNLVWKGTWNESKDREHMKRVYEDTTLKDCGVEILRLGDVTMRDGDTQRAPTGGRINTYRGIVERIGSKVGDQDYMIGMTPDGAVVKCKRLRTEHGEYNQWDRTYTSLVTKKTQTLEYVIVYDKCKVWCSEEKILTISCAIKKIGDYVRPKWVLIEGIAGAGKTYRCIKTATAQDMIVCSTKYAMLDTRNKLVKDGVMTMREAKRRCKTIDSVAINGTKIVANVLWIDEGLMEHAAMLHLMVALIRPVIVYVLGDRSQLNFINRVDRVKMSSESFEAWDRVETIFVTQRCPIPAMAAVAPIYRKRGFDPLTAKHGKKRMDTTYIADAAGIPRLAEDYQYVTWYQDDKERIKAESRKPGRGHLANIHTIGEVQGQTFKNVALVRLSTKSRKLFDSDPHMLVALTRHTDTFKYYTALNGPDYCQELLDYGNDSNNWKRVTYTGGDSSKVTHYGRNMKTGKTVPVIVEDNKNRPQKRV